MIKKYRMLGGNLGGKGSPITYREVAMDKIPDPRLLEHVQLPPETSRDIVTFGAKYVESRENLNRAYFANEELLKAYNTIPYKALDVEHNVEEVIGHIYSSIFVDRKSNTVLDPMVLAKLSPEELNKIDIDVIVGGVVYVDRFPRLEGPVQSKAYKISMETYFDEFDILLENGVRLSHDEAIGLGLEEFIDQLMGSFESQDEFDKAHTLQVTVADSRQMKMKVFKYLKGLLFSGGGLVLNPACPSCHILTTSGDQEEEEMKVAASKVFSLDLRKHDPYMEEQESGKPRVHQVTEGLDCPCNNGETEQATDVIAAPPPNLNPPAGIPKTPSDYTNMPMACPQYRLDADMWCLFANKQCVTAGDRSFRDCHRWLKDPSGRWLFDTRNTTDTEEEVVISDIMGSEASGGEDDVSEEASMKTAASMNYAIKAAEYALEAREARKDNGAVWTTQFINNLPNSSFAVVETGYKEGMSKTARHLPFKDGGGKVDLAHLRNARARANQIKSVLGNDSDADLRKRAMAKLEPYAKRFLKIDQEGGA
jgi:hypothetical protein